MGVSLILSLNPALMFTLVDKISSVVKRFKKVNKISASEMFQISAVAKMIATLFTYPMIRAKVIMQTQKAGGPSLLPTLVGLMRTEGLTGLYTGVWLLSYKSVLFNAFMMTAKH